MHMNKRLSALMIGNGAYMQVGTLTNPTNDADDIADILVARGFDVIKKTDCTHKEMDLAVKELRASLKKSDVGLFFFAVIAIQARECLLLLRVRPTQRGIVFEDVRERAHWGAHGHMDWVVPAFLFRLHDQEFQHVANHGFIRNAKLSRDRSEPRGLPA
jgi:hypothetical protein